MNELKKKCFACEEAGKSGLMVFKEGTSKKNNKPYMGWFCEKNKDHIEWVKEPPQKTQSPSTVCEKSGLTAEIHEEKNYSFPQSYAKDIICHRIDKGYYDDKDNLVLALDYAGLIRACIGFESMTSPIEEVKTEVTPF